MKNFYTFTTMLLLFSLALKAQDTYSAKGSVGDASLKVKLPNTTISLLNSKDSTLYRFTRVSADGNYIASS